MSSDITMCRGTNCEVKEKCYRHTAQPDKHWQSQFVKTPEPSGEACEFYWPTKVEDKR